MTDRKPYSLGKTERLKSRKQIDLLFQSGKKISQFPFRLLYLTIPGKSCLQAGFTVSSKNFPRAVDRNRIKRLSRESYRLQKKDLESFSAKTGTMVQLFLIYTGREILSFDEVFMRMKQLMEKLIRVLNEDNTANS